MVALQKRALETPPESGHRCMPNMSNLLGIFSSVINTETTLVVTVHTSASVI